MDRLRDFDALRDSVSNYENGGMDQITNHVRGTAFFPCGKGTWFEDNSDGHYPIGKIMILGQDFGTTEYVSHLVDREDIDTNPTWIMLSEILHGAFIKEQDCFFTNAIMGSRSKGHATGKSPAFKNEVFMVNCFAMVFSEQVRLLKPELIICCGKRVYEFLKLCKVLGFQDFDAKKT